MNWREPLLKRILSTDSRLVILLDPDNLLPDERFAEEIRKSQYDILTYRDPIDFRFHYESDYRSKWDRDEAIGKKLLVTFQSADAASVPVDLKHEGTVLKITISDVFPLFNPLILEQIGISLFDEISTKCQFSGKEKLSESNTQELILKCLYGIEPDQITTSILFIIKLCTIHNQNQEIPAILCDYIVNKIKQQVQLENIPLRQLFDRNYFFSFLQGQWGPYLRSILDESVPVIPFHDPSIRVFIDTFFFDGLLQPIECEQYSRLPQWTLCGVKIDPFNDAKRRIEGLMGLLDGHLPDTNANYKEWIRAAWRWAEVICLYSGFKKEKLDSTLDVRIKKIHAEIEANFEKWVKDNFRSLQNTPYLPKPVVVHHIVHYLAAQSKKKIALLILDGLALDQWTLIRQDLRSSFRFEEEALFAWVPTLTSISRRAIFSGENPYALDVSLEDYESERRFWNHFWMSHGYKDNEIALIKALKFNDSEEIEEIHNIQNKHVLGIVINTIDDLLKTSDITTSDLHQFVKNWINKGHFVRFIQKLSTWGFEVYISSDHGNICSIGIGNIREGVLVEEKSARAKIYQNTQLRDRAYREIGEGIPYDDPDFNYAVLLSEGLAAFYKEGVKIISHGGISLEEMVVPFIAIHRDE